VHSYLWQYLTRDDAPNFVGFIPRWTTWTSLVLSKPNPSQEGRPSCSNPLSNPYHGSFSIFGDPNVIAASLPVTRAWPCTTTLSSRIELVESKYSCLPFKIQ